MMRITIRVSLTILFIGCHHSSSPPGSTARLFLQAVYVNMEWPKARITADSMAAMKIDHYLTYCSSLPQDSIHHPWPVASGLTLTDSVILDSTAFFRYDLWKPDPHQTVTGLTVGFIRLQKRYDGEWRVVDFGYLQVLP